MSTGSILVSIGACVILSGCLTERLLELLDWTPGNVWAFAPESRRTPGNETND